MCDITSSATVCELLLLPTLTGNPLSTFYQFRRKAPKAYNFRLESLMRKRLAQDWQIISLSMYIIDSIAASCPQRETTCSKSSNTVRHRIITLTQRLLVATTHRSLHYRFLLRPDVNMFVRALNQDIEFGDMSLDCRKR